MESINIIKCGTCSELAPDNFQNIDLLIIIHQLIVHLTRQLYFSLFLNVFPVPDKYFSFRMSFISCFDLIFRLKILTWALCNFFCLCFPENFKNFPQMVIFSLVRFRLQLRRYISFLISSK